MYFKCTLDASLQRLPAGDQKDVPCSGNLLRRHGDELLATYKLFLYLLRSNTIATIFSILAGIVTYTLLLFALKGLTEQEILRFPKGRAVVSLAKRLHLLH